jgi:thioredoxin 2
MHETKEREASSGVVVACGACGKKNRVPSTHLADTGRCGACRSALPPRSEPIEVGPAEFDEIIRNSRVPVLVDFWAAWCAPCRMAAPEVAKTAKEMAGRAIVLKVNTEEYPGVAARYGVQGIPNFLVLKSGLVLRQQAGLVPSATMNAWLTAAAG